MLLFSKLEWSFPSASIRLLMEGKRKALPNISRSP